MMLFSTYRELGGLAGALALHAERRFEQLDEAVQSVARSLIGRRNFSMAEWEEYMPAGEEYRATCPESRS